MIDSSADERRTSEAPLFQRAAEISLAVWPTPVKQRRSAGGETLISARPPAPDPPRPRSRAQFWGRNSGVRAHLADRRRWLSTKCALTPIDPDPRRPERSGCIHGTRMGSMRTRHCWQNTETGSGLIWNPGNSSAEMGHHRGCARAAARPAREAACLSHPAGIRRKDTTRTAVAADSLRL